MNNSISREEAVTLMAWAGMFRLPAEDKETIIYEHLSEDEPFEGIINIETAAYNDYIVEYLKEGLKCVSNTYIERELAEIFSSEIKILGAPEVYEPCLCCGYRTIKSRGEYFICPVCYWEDDGLADPDGYSQVNKMTLKQAIENYKTTGVSDARFDKVVSREPDKYLKD
jgi:hypothetical protein